MKNIDLESWKRKEHFHFFKKMANPHFNICANVDITNLKAFTGNNNLSLFRTVLYIAIRSANNIEAFRQRIIGNTVIEHETVHARFTVPGKQDIFGFCAVAYSNDFKEFYLSALSEIEKASENPEVSNLVGRDDLIYMSCLPWISFTSYSNAMHLHPVDSIPRIVWGKYFEEGGKIKMPLSVQVHHALADGSHVGKYFSYFSNLCLKPEQLLENNVK